MNHAYIIGPICVALALILDISSYWRQIDKILKTKKSTQVSSTSYLYKIAKATFATIGLIVYSNYVGVIMELVMFATYAASLVVICKYKPRGWRLFK